MNYHCYYDIDVVNGPGTRCTLFVSGCEHQCRGCYNKSTWRIDSGHPFTQQLEDKIIDDLNNKEINRQGISLLGGDPLHPHNLSDILKLVMRIKQQCNNKDIWLWTGYQLNELSNNQKKILPYIDVLIDGKFVQELAAPNLQWRGSSNQIIHYL